MKKNAACQKPNIEPGSRSNQILSFRSLLILHSEMNMHINIPCSLIHEQIKRAMHVIDSLLLLHILLTA